MAARSEDLENGAGSTPQATGHQTLVYLVRHGVTDWNIEHRFQGHLDVPLNSEGLKQADAVADWLARQPVQFAALYSSDLTRARQTADRIGRAIGLIPILSRALREIDVGEWEGLSIQEIEERHPGQIQFWHEHIHDFTLPGGESVALVQTRIFEFYRLALARHRGQAFVIVSHGMALEALQAAIHEWDLLETFHSSRARLGNTGVTAISIEPQSGPRQIILNSSVHLDSSGPPEAADEGAGVA